jgi:hypothetical protein
MTNNKLAIIGAMMSMLKKTSASDPEATQEIALDDKS